MVRLSPLVTRLRSACFVATYAFSMVCIVCMVSVVHADDRHAGYYYPEPQTSEAFTGRAPLLQDAGKRARVAVTTGISNQLASGPGAPMVAIFAKGTQAEKLIIVALREGELNTLFRMRGFLARLTAEARASPIFANASNPEELTFLDFIASLGFERLTASDGRDFAHRIELSPAR